MNLLDKVWTIFVDGGNQVPIRAPAFNCNDEAHQWLNPRVGRAGKESNLKEVVMTSVIATDQLPSKLWHSTTYWIIVNKSDYLPVKHLPVFLDGIKAQEALNNDLLCTRDIYMMVKVQVRG